MAQYTTWNYKYHRKRDLQPEKMWDALFLYDVYLYDYQKRKRLCKETTFDNKEAAWTYIREQKKLRKGSLFVVDRRKKHGTK